MKKLRLRAIEKGDLERLLQELPASREAIRCENCKRELSVDDIAAVSFVGDRVLFLCNNPTCQHLIPREGRRNATH